MEGYMAEIRMFGGSFAPRSWAYCQGQLMSIAQNSALFSLLGTTYGGDGRNTFALPDFRGRAATGTGTGSALPTINLGQQVGYSSVTLNITNLPPHSHSVINAGTIPVTGNISASMKVNSSVSNSNTPKNCYLGAESGGSGFYDSTSTGQTLNSAAIQIPSSTLGVNSQSISIQQTGSNTPIDTHMPSLGMNFIICLQGIYPSRN